MKQESTRQNINMEMTKDYFQEKYNCNSSLIFYYFKNSKKKNIQQIDNIIQERQILKLKTQNIITDKTRNDIIFQQYHKSLSVCNKSFQNNGR